MKLIIDADACPGLDIITKVAKDYSIKMLIYTDFNHNITNDYGEVITVDQGFQSVDMYISNITETNDVVVTQDYGLALIALSKGAFAIHPKGTIYDNDNIDKMIFERHISAMNRKRNKRFKGPKKRTKEDDLLLEENLIKLLKKK
ncbi:MAG: YaiI/YqxD family protein [Bacilli bacterium]|nr:YaiI/YqxD family protein [Bacilli bacterium]MDD4547688.1 YaiI/YqxD family protein [Bacilli bacterium]